MGMVLFFVHSIVLLQLQPIYCAPPQLILTTFCRILPQKIKLIGKPLRLAISIIIMSQQSFYFPYEPQLENGLLWLKIVFIGLYKVKIVTISCSIVEPVHLGANLLKSTHHYTFPFLVTFKQSHYREVPRWDIFMEPELRFVLNLGRMADFPAFIASKSFDL